MVQRLLPVHPMPNATVLLMRASAVLGLALALAGGPAAGEGKQAGVTINVEPGGWGSAQPRDIRSVLASVADEISRHLAPRANLNVQVSHSSAGPRILFDRTADGKHRILLNVRNARWDQFTYQFAHELCHLVSGHEQRGTAGAEEDHLWFEESLCEAVSLFALERMASVWDRSPPHPHWREYAPAFREYRQRLLAEEHRRLPAGMDFRHWYARQQADLEQTPYGRARTELIAVKLLALLEEDPAAFSAVSFLGNEAPPQRLRTLHDYLAWWRSCCPPGQRELVERVMQLFQAPAALDAAT